VGISLRLKSISGDVLQVSEGSLYPALHKLEQEGWISAEWKQTENNRRAKFYSLTRLGRKQLASEAAELAAAFVRHLARRPAFGGIGKSYADGALVVHGALTAQVRPAPRTCGTGSSMRSCSSTWSTRSRKASPRAFAKRGALRGVARDGTDWNNGKRR